MTCEYCDTYHQQPTGTVRSYVGQDGTEWHLCERCAANAKLIAKMFNDAAFRLRLKEEQ